MSKLIQIVWTNYQTTGSPWIYNRIDSWTNCILIWNIVTQNHFPHRNQFYEWESGGWYFYYLYCTPNLVRLGGGGRRVMSFPRQNGSTGPAGKDDPISTPPSQQGIRLQIGGGGGAKCLPIHRIQLVCHFLEQQHTQSSFQAHCSSWHSHLWVFDRRPGQASSTSIMTKIICSSTPRPPPPPQTVPWWDMAQTGSKDPLHLLHRLRLEGLGSHCSALAPLQHTLREPPL